MRELVPTLSLFIKYLNPQILADHIAKEFEKTKKHRNIIFALKTALRSLKFARGIGYRIAIVGRINSSTKSRAFYLTKKSLIRQNFSQKINYATAQAKARIGSFGIKV
jgi:ribosomal protein S3